MKRLLFVIAVVCLLLASIGFVACQEEEKESKNKVFTGITFEGKTLTYDGGEHKIEIEGVLPDGAVVSYKNNVGSDAGIYKATAKITKEGYDDLELSANLIIQKANFSGITLPDKTVIYDGRVHSLIVEGDLPEGTTVRYENNGQTEGGEYIVKAYIENKNYNTLKLEGKLNIRTLADAVDIVNQLLARPNVWSFMPGAFANENMSCAVMPQVDFATQSRDVQSISKKFLGKQMNVVYNVLNNSQAVLEKADIVFTAGEGIAALYQKFINDNPDDYSEFIGNIKIANTEFSVKIALQEGKSLLLIGNNTINIELMADSDAKINIARIQITDGLTLKYTMTDTTLRLAIIGAIGSVHISYSLEFIRDNDVVTGYLYEYYGIKDKAIKTTGLITSNENYTYIVSNKRETDDLAIQAYQEVYDSKTGEFIGAEVSENVKNVNFDTLWYNLYDITGIYQVKVSEEQNGLNADTIYINNQTTPFESKKIGGISLDMASRRYDIEMKEVWYIVAETSQDGKTTYSSEKALIPMLFVQKKSIETFSEDIKEKNKYILNSELPLNYTGIITDNFTSTSEIYKKLKEEMSYEDIELYIGEKNDFFVE